MLRTWPALFAWGAGLIHLAVGASVVGGGHGWPAVMLLAATLVMGVVELGWGAAVMRTGRIIRGRSAAVAAIVAVVVGTGGIAAGASPIAVAAASALAVAGGSMAARLSKAGEGRTVPGEGTARSARSRVAGLVLGAVVVAALVTPGLAQTDAGLNGIAHGHHADVELPLTDPHAHHGVP